MARDSAARPRRISTNRRVMRFWIMLLSRSRAPGAVSARSVTTQAGDAKTIHPGEPVVPVGSLALTHLAPPQAVELLWWSAVGRDLCQCDDPMALGCQVAATSAGLAAAYPRRDQPQGGARCGTRVFSIPSRPALRAACGRPRARRRPDGHRRTNAPSRRRHGDARLHNIEPPARPRPRPRPRLTPPSHLEWMRHTLLRGRRGLAHRAAAPGPLTGASSRMASFAAMWAYQPRTPPVGRRQASKNIGRSPEPGQLDGAGVSS
jgi:hypothetical protein